MNDRLIKILKMIALGHTVHVQDLQFAKVKVTALGLDFCNLIDKIKREGKV